MTEQEKRALIRGYMPDMAKRTIEERRAYQKAYYHRTKVLSTRVPHPDPILYRRERAARQHAVVSALKARPCMDCRGTFPPVCMDFDHRDPSTKVGSVSKMIAYTLPRIMAEIAKCDLVCANCHRIRTDGRHPNKRNVN